MSEDSNWLILRTWPAHFTAVSCEYVFYCFLSSDILELPSSGHKVQKNLLSAMFYCVRNETENKDSVAFADVL